MPAFGNITVKKNDGTTDVGYFGIVAANNESPAVWMAPALGATDATRPEFRVWSTRKVRNGETISKVNYSAMYPYSVVDTTTGVTTVLKRGMAKGYFEISRDVPNSVIDEFASQFTNFLASAGMKAMIKEGYAAT